MEPPAPNTESRKPMRRPPPRRRVLSKGEVLGEAFMSLDA
jgi:hypothetical protein